MSLIRVFDASTPPLRPYPGCSGVAGYIGGNTPHVWTVAEWNNASNDGNLAVLPIWVGYLEANPADHARQAAQAATGLGWTPYNPGVWRAIVLDMEAEANEPWILAFGTTLQTQGFLCWPYLSTSALPSDPPGYSVWLPTWNGIATVPRIHDVIAAQFQPNVPYEGTHVDLSVFDSTYLSSFGHGPRQ